MEYIYRHGGVSRNRGKIRVLVTLLLVVLVIGGVYITKRLRAQKPSNQPTSSVAISSKQVINNESSTIKGRYLLNGTVVWARGIEKWSQRPNGTYDYVHPFSQLSSFNRQQYDAWVADLECPITNKTIPFQVQIDTLMFNCPPEFLPEAAKYFNIFNLANNHTDNRQHEGLVSTREYLDKAGVQYHGNYDPEVAEDTCEVISLPAREIDEKSNKSTPTNLPVAFCSWHYFYRTPKPGEIERMAEYAKIMPVFAFVHAGVEYRTTADDTQVAIARKIIDQNAEFVIVNNPHWVQNSEAYKGKLIVYSTGNFIFDQLDSEGMRSASIDVSLTLKNDTDTKSWLELSKTCQQWHDNCLKLAQEKGLKKPKLQLSYAAVGGDNSNRQTKKASPTLQKAIEDRLNWQKTMSELTSGH